MVMVTSTAINNRLPKPSGPGKLVPVFDIKKLVVRACPVCLAVTTVMPVTAADWTTSASVTPGVVYTDNVCLSKNNTQDEWIGTVTPAGSINADGNRANLDITGSVEFNTLSDGKLDDLGCTGGNFGNRQQFAPSLNGTADAILIDQWFFVDATTSISQNQVTPFASGGDDSFDRTGNTNTTYDYSVSPYIARRFKNIAEMNLRYTWDEQFNSTDAVRDSSEESVQALISSVPGVNRYSWGLQGDYSKVKYSDSNFPLDSAINNQDSELKSAQLNLGYQLSRVWQINGFYGNEWNDFVSSRDDIDGTFWDLGVRWTPNTRTVVEAGVGDRFFGKNPRFSVTHRHKRSAFDASYAKTLTYDRDIRTLPGAPPLDPSLPPPPVVDSGLTTISNSPILDERFTLGYSWQGLRTGFGISAFHSEQTQESGESITGFSESTYSGVSISANRNLSQQMTLNIGANWNEQKPKNSADEVGQNFFDKSETWTGTLGITQQLGQRTSLGLNYQYTDRQSDNELDSYTENQVTLDLTIELY